VEWICLRRELWRITIFQVPEVESLYVLQCHVTGKSRGEWRRDVMTPTDASWVLNGTRISLSPEPLVFAIEGSMSNAQRPTLSNYVSGLLVENEGNFITVSPPPPLSFPLPLNPYSKFERSFALRLTNCGVICHTIYPISQTT
jgi:hypothetical protein